MTDHHSSPKMASKLLSGLVGPKVDIRIYLTSKRKIYSTLDRLQGTVTFTLSTDLPFDEIDIEFVGTSRTYVERMTTAAAVSGRSQAFHQFLRLSQPGVAEHYPEDHILRAGQTYKIPFVFAVPQQLLPRVCGHCVHNNSVREAHLQLPPSLGDCDEDSKEQLDDLAPEMASIRYGVYAKISKLKQENGELRRATIVAKARRVRLVPAVEEQPPLNVDGNADFSLRKEKKLRKGLFKGRLGTLVMETQQPASFRRPAPDAEAGGRTTTMATVLLRFDPAETNAQPPRLNSLTSKLKATTFYSTAARRSMPTRSDGLNELSNGYHTETMEISSRCMANVDWIRTENEGPISPDQSQSPRRTSSVVSGPIMPPQPSASYNGGAFYVARILVPIELPSHKTFVPTFHSCLISRTYALGLSLSTQTNFGGNIDMRIPVQVSASPSLRNDCPRPSIVSMSSLDVDDEGDSTGVDEFFEPRTIHAPESGYLGGSRLRGSIAEPAVVRHDSVVVEPEANASGLPEYSLFAPGARGRRAGVPVF